MAGLSPIDLSGVEHKYPALLRGREPTPQECCDIQRLENFHVSPLSEQEKSLLDGIADLDKLPRMTNADSFKEHMSLDCNKTRKSLPPRMHDQDQSKECRSLCQTLCILERIVTGKDFKPLLQPTDFFTKETNEILCKLQSHCVSTDSVIQPTKPISLVLQDVACDNQWQVMHDIIGELQAFIETSNDIITQQQKCIDELHQQHSNLETSAKEIGQNRELCLTVVESYFQLIKNQAVPEKDKTKLTVMCLQNMVDILSFENNNEFLTAVEKLVESPLVFFKRKCKDLNNVIAEQNKLLDKMSNKIRELTSQ